jgi:hypothetical protein
MSESQTRRLRGALGNALLWGAAWSALGFTVATTLSGSWLTGLVLSVKFGVIGVLAGAAFSSVVPLVYHGRRVSEMSPVRFGIAGGIVAGLFVPAFLQSMNVLSGGGPIAWGLVLDDAPVAAVFGAVAAGASLALAKRADALAPGIRRQWLGGGESADQFSTPVRDRVAR